MSHNDTIVAQATPPGRGGVGILRISGLKARDVAQAVLGKLPKPRYADYLPFNDVDGTPLDQGIALWFPGPNSFTGEDVLELQGHGGPVILDLLLKRILTLPGLRIAKPGEFSERAFLNDKLDLAQAEAIADLIDASSEQAARSALNSLQGAFSARVNHLVEALTHLRIYVEAAIDFPDEEIDFLSDGKIEAQLNQVMADLDAVRAEARQGSLLREGMKVVIAGRPNAGKSSLLNALAGREAAIVTDIAGTTRDSIYTRYNKFGMDFYLVDTAGMRKKGKTMEDLEFYSVMRSIRAIENSDVCILMLDAQQGLESQDLNIHNLIVRNRKGCVIVVNKWDLIEKDNNTMKEWTEFLKKKLAPFNDIPIIFTSVLSKQRIFDVLQTAIRVYQSRKRRISTSELNDFLLPLIENYPPPATKGKYIKIKYVTQLPTPTPQFAFFVNLPQYIKEPYRRFLENNMRDHWDFSGVPVQIYFRQK